MTLLVGDELKGCMVNQDEVQEGPVERRNQTMIAKGDLNERSPPWRRSSGSSEMGSRIIAKAGTSTNAEARCTTIDDGLNHEATSHQHEKSYDLFGLPRFRVTSSRSPLQIVRCLPWEESSWLAVGFVTL